MVYEAKFPQSYNKAMLDQGNTLRLVGSKGNQDSMTFFIDTSLPSNQGQAFLFSPLIFKLIYARY